MNEEQSRLHRELLTEINDQLDVTSAEYAAFKLQIVKPLGGHGVLGRCQDLFAIFKQLSKRGKLGILKYGVLKTAFKGSSNDDIVELIEDKEQEIKHTGVTPDTGARSAKPPGKRKPQDVIYDRKEKAQRNNPEEEDPSDGKFMTKEGLGYYETAGKTGFLLILYFDEDRPHLRSDLGRLTGFFEDTLHFDVVIVPRPGIPGQSQGPDYADDLTRGQVTAALRAVRTYLNKPENAQKYYCFMCVTLSHGGELYMTEKKRHKGITQGTITTKDGPYPVDDIYRMFNNREMPEFAAKPKLFIIQACQGYEQQDCVRVDDEADDEHKPAMLPPQIDESDTIVHIPQDADILFTFATTPGYSFMGGPMFSGEGTYLIKHLVDVFRTYHGRLHLEDLMISVRELTSQTYPLGTEDGAMMPYTWSTLTKRLEFTAGQSTWGSRSAERERRWFPEGQSESVFIDSVLFA